MIFEKKAFKILPTFLGPLHVKVSKKKTHFIPKNGFSC